MKTKIGSLPRPNAVLRLCRELLLLPAVLAFIFLPSAIVQAVSSDIVIVEAYGGGGNSGSVYKNDFIGLFNRGASTVNVTGWSVQYASTTGSSWSKTDLSGSIPPGGYYLIQEAAGAGGTTSLPTPDAVGTIAMGGTGFKVALVNNTTLLTTTNSTGPTIVDFVGCGAATSYEGAAAPAPSNANSVQRAGGGCTDTDNNSADFTAAAANPRNSATPLAPCGGGGNAPFIAVHPQSATNWPGSTATFTTTVTGDAPLSYFWQSNEVNLVNGGQISGANTNVLTITSVNAAFETTYRLIVTNLSGAATSSVVSLVISSNAPTIVSDPLSRDGILGQTATFQVLAAVAGNITGAPATQYRWQSNSVDIMDGGRFSGATTAKLTISGLVADDAGTYSCVVSNDAGGTTSSGATLTVSDSGTLAFWNFNIANNPASPEVYYGLGTAALAGTTNGFFSTADDGNDPGNPSKYWGTSQYPPNPASPATNKTHGVRFNVDTTGLRNVIISLSTRLTAQASKYSRLQYTTDGTTFTDYPASSTNMAGAGGWDSTGSSPANAGRIFDLSGFPGVRNNPNFGFRIVTETANTATYGMSSITNYVALDGTDANYSTTFGTVNYDLVNIAAATTNSTPPPTIAALSSFTILDSDPATNITLTVAGTGSLNVTAKSFNPAVIPDSLAPSTTTLTITPTAGMVGTAPILVTVSDAFGNSAVTWFNVTVIPGNFAPTISAIPNTNMLSGTSISLPFTVGDDQTPVGTLVLSTNSENPLLVPNSGISITGTAPNYSLVVTPTPGSNGVATITVTVTDGGSLSATSRFALMVRPTTNVAFIDGFQYPDGILTATSAGLYVTHAAGNNPAKMDVASGRLNVTDTRTEDVNGTLVGGPYLVSAGDVLYSSFTINMSSLPSAGGGYFAHFKDDGVSNFRDRIYASTLNAASGKYRIGTGNTSGTTNSTAQFPLDLDLNTDYRVVTRLILSNGVSTVWVNPTDETGGVTDTTVVASPVNIHAFAFRQAVEFGTMTIDNLVIGRTFNSVMGLPDVVAPTPETITHTVSGTNLILSWTQGTWTGLMTGTNVTVITNEIPGATSPYTNALSGPQNYFRLYYKP